MATPSSRRREGRKAFIPGEDPNLLCPYNSDWSKRDWMEGWEREQANCDLQERTQQLETEQWDALKYSCPWYDIAECGGTCKATQADCEKENCAPYYFK